MDENLQRIFTVLVAVIMMFILPLYMAFEKKDDISYSLALKVTSNFVNEVTSKGYITREMYDSLLSGLAGTDNAYDIKLQHRKKLYYPVLELSSSAEPGIKYRIDYALLKSEYEMNKTSNGVAEIDLSNTNVSDIGIKNKDGGILTGTYNAVLTYELRTELISENQILEVIDRTIDGKGKYKMLILSIANNDTEKLQQYKENVSIARLPHISNMYAIQSKTKDASGNDVVTNKAIYSLSEGDEFTVIIKNTNTSIATTLFKTFTMGMADKELYKIYINYGGTVKNSIYSGE